MGSRGWLSFDLNEPPAEDIEESDSVASLQQPQKTLPSANLNNASEVIAIAAAAGSTQGIVNNKAFSHVSSVSGFQPFSRCQCAAQVSDGNVDLKEASYRIRNDASNNEDVKAVSSVVSVAADVPSVEREEGEWSDADGSADAHRNGSLLEQGKASDSAPDGRQRNVKSSEDLKAESSNSRNSDNNVKGHVSMDYHEEPGLVPKQEKVKGIEVARGLKGANIPVKRKTDHLNEAKLGKKRSRQTMFLNLEDVKQAGPIKTSTPRRHAIPAPITTRTMKESCAVSPPVVLPPTDHIGENQSQPIVKEQNIVCSEVVGDFSESARLKKQNGDTDSSAEAVPPIPRQSSYKQPLDTRLPKNSQVAKRKPVAQSSMDLKLGNKKPSAAKKQMTVSNMYQDTSVERLIREVTNEKFWHNPVLHGPPMVTL